MDNNFGLTCRTRSLETSDEGFVSWQVRERSIMVPAQETALLLCDVWDHHWCGGAEVRLEKMLERMNETVAAARDRGATIIHSPSGTMASYQDSKARARAIETPQIAPPEEQAHEDPPLPVDASDGGCDTGQPRGDTKTSPWIRQHSGIGIDEEKDYISDEGREVYSILGHAGIHHLIILGVHTNMCVLNRGFAIKQMVRWGVDTMLCRDLTDTMYNPAKPPYVNHDEGTRLVIEYIERFWCPTLLSQDLT